MPPKEKPEGCLYIQTPYGYRKVETLETIEPEPVETEQDRLNQMAVDAIRAILPENMELIMNNGR